jgi:hypothetical protein
MSGVGVHSEVQQPVLHADVIQILFRVVGRPCNSPHTKCGRQSIVAHMSSFSVWVRTVWTDSSAVGHAKCASGRPSPYKTINHSKRA